jgi:cyclic pyranopterin phosphate synthase
MVAAIEDVADLSLTTNGLLLPRFAADLAAAGLRRVNVSIDSLDPLRFTELTRGAHLDQALAGLEAAFAAGFSPVKLNVVLLAGIEREVEDFAELTRERAVHVRFIEHMPLDRRLSLEGEFIPSPQVLELLRRSYALEAVDGVYGHGPARYYRVPGYPGTIGFIAGVSEHFCESCNRLRLTADGRLRTCLFSGDEIAVRPLIAHPRELRAAITAAVSGKSYDRCRELLANERAMSEIGG